MPFLRYVFCCIFLTMLLVSSCQPVEEPAIRKWVVEAPMAETFQRIYQALEEAKFYVIFEASIGKSLAYNAKRWGEDYNRNHIEDVSAMLFCNPWYTNQIMNLDPHMVSVCPLSITVMHKEKKTTILFPRLSLNAEKSPAYDLLLEIEHSVANAIEDGLRNN